MNIAIFGGSFDPFHIGHEKIVQLSLEKLAIEQLFIIPTFLNPFKNSSFLDANTRLDLLNTMYKNEEKIKIIDYEVKRKKVTTSYESVVYLEKNYNLDKIYLIIGADNLKDVHLWYNFKNLKKKVEFVVFNRDKQTLENKYIKAINIELDINISSSKLRKQMDIKYIPKKIQTKVKKLWKTE